MAGRFSLENLTVSRKLALGFGLLLALAVLLALTGLYGLRSDGQSLTRINRLGALFDETVYAREANYAYALTADPARRAAQDKHVQTLRQALLAVRAEIDNGSWPREDLAAIDHLRGALDRYVDARQRALDATGAGPQAVIRPNALLSTLQADINTLYLAEEARAAVSVHQVQIVLLAVTALALLLGGLIAWLIGRQITRPLQQTLLAAERIASGDLTVELHSRRTDELGQLLRAIGHMNDRLREVIGQIRGGSHQLAASATQLATITSQTRAGIDSQKNETGMVATAMGQMTASVREVARSAEEAALAARQADDEACSALAVSRQAVTQIEALAGEVGQSAASLTRLHRESERIAGVLEVIKEVAGQTNLLALNATIEAARAGEAGRGIAVVADEVRKLALRTQQSSEEIDALITGLQHITEESARMMQASVAQTRATVDGVRNTGEALTTITRQVADIQLMSTQIATAAEQQSCVAEEVNRSVLNVRETTDQSAQASVEIATSSVELARLGTDLQQLVGHFRT